MHPHADTPLPQASGAKSAMRNDAVLLQLPAMVPSTSFSSFLGHGMNPTLDDEDQLEHEVDMGDMETIFDDDEDDDEVVEVTRYRPKTTVTSTIAQGGFESVNCTASVLNSSQRESLSPRSSPVPSFASPLTMEPPQLASNQETVDLSHYSDQIHQPALNKINSGVLSPVLSRLPRTTKPNLEYEGTTFPILPQEPQRIQVCSTSFAKTQASPETDSFQEPAVPGSRPDNNGFLPIHRACRDHSLQDKLIELVIKTFPNGVRRKVENPLKSDQRDRHICHTVANGTAEQVRELQQQLRKDQRQKQRRRLQNSAGFINTPGPSRKRTSDSQESVSIDNSFEGSYPIHIAIVQQASLSVINMLATMAPEVLVMGDASGAVPLSVAFRANRCAGVLACLLNANPAAASTTDKKRNTPLHHFCMNLCESPSSTCEEHLLVVKTLVALAPDALHQRNFNGYTPLDLAQKSGHTCDVALSHLQKVAFQHEDDDVMEL